MEDEVVHREEAALAAMRAEAERDDATLVAAVLRKDRKATADFVTRFSDEVYAYVRSRLAPRYDQVEDLMQEIFMAAWRSLPQYRGDGPLRSWMCAIARHKVEDYYRRCMRAPESLDKSDSDHAKIEPSFDLRDILEYESLRSETLHVLQGLPEPYRLALIWRYWERTSARDMALKTGKTEKAIERLLARARAEFRQRWKSGRT
jgi:RNA polymerase sigma-70 factor, ECF subfamily